MSRPMWIIPAVALLALSACDRQPPAAPAPAGAEGAPAVAAPTSGGDPELAQLQAVAPVDACTWLTPDKLKQVEPDLTFEVHQKVEPRISGYVWDSRCVYWAGVGSIEFAKDTPTHTVEIFVATSASEATARAKLAARRELATSTSGYQPQAELGADAYATVDTGTAMLFFAKGQSQVQINVSSLKTPNDEKIAKAVALAKLL